MTREGRSKGIPRERGGGQVSRESKEGQGSDGVGEPFRGGEGSRGGGGRAIGAPTRAGEGSSVGKGEPEEEGPAGMEGGAALRR